MDPSAYSPSGSYRRGMIKKVTMRNFLTWSETTVAPGPRLNVVIGPNGTGKSSIVCAICLCLGGKPKLLGRSDDIHAFVRHGCSEANIVVELYGGPGQDSIIVERTIYKEEGRSGKFYYNGATIGVTKLKKKMMQGLGIQLENLCQFLPQDKVGDFAKLNNVDRLVETERAVLGDDAVALHTELSEQYARHSAKEGEHGTLTQTIVTQERDFERLKKDKAHFDRMERSIRERDLLEGLLPWTHVFAHAAKYKAAKAEKARLKTQMVEVRKQQAPLKKKVAAADKVALGRDKQSTTATKAARSARSAARRVLGQCEERVDAVEEANEALVTVGMAKGKMDDRVARQKLKAAAARRERDARVASKEEALERKTRATEAFNELKEETETADADLRPIAAEIKKLGQRKKHAAGRAKRAAAAHAKRTMALMKKLKAGKQTKQATFALRLAANKGRDRLEREVLGPAVSAFTVEDKLHGKWMNTAISSSVMVTLVAQSTADFKTLRQWQGSNSRFAGSKIMSIEAQQIAKLGAARVVSLDDASSPLRRLGISGYLIDLIKGPDAIKALLTVRSNLDKQLYCERSLADDASRRQQITDALEAVMREKSVNQLNLYTPDERIEFKISRYGERRIGVTASRLKYNNQLEALVVQGGGGGGGGGDGEADAAAALEETRECDRQSEELHEKQEALKKDTSALRKRYRAAAEESDAAMKGVTAIKRSEAAAKKEERKLEQLIADRDGRDFAQEKRDAERVKSAMEGKVCAHLGKIGAAQEKAASLEQLSEIAALDKIVAEEHVKLLRVEHSRVLEQTMELERQYKDSLEKIKEIKKEHKKLLSEATATLKLGSPEVTKLVDEYHEAHPNQVNDMTGELDRLTWHDSEAVLQVAERDKIETWLAIAKGRANAGVRNENAVEECVYMQRSSYHTHTKRHASNTELTPLSFHHLPFHSFPPTHPTFHSVLSFLH